MQMPFITIAIPTYRRLPMLRRAIESVLAQTFTDWEMVVSDDAHVDHVKLLGGRATYVTSLMARLCARVRFNDFSFVNVHAKGTDRGVFLRGARRRRLKHSRRTERNRCKEKRSARRR